MKKKVLLALILILSLSACDKIIKEMAASGKEELTIENLKIINVNEEYSLAIPTYMKEMKSLHDEASLEYANVYKETYIVVIDEGKKEFVALFKELDIYDEKLSPLDNYADFQVKSLIESIEKTSDNSVDIKIKSISSKYHELHGKIDGVKIGYLLGFVESDNKMFMIMTWTLDSRYNKYENTFKTIQKSFKLIK
jgi:hypothetical protein